MLVVNSVAALQKNITVLRAKNQRIAFVPTMGNLHAGHRALMERAHGYADVVIASIFVNPLQFGPNEDFATYPRTPEADEVLLTAAGVDIVLMPAEQDIYPRGQLAQTRVEVPGISKILDGAHRPDHFCGVTTVVNRLFNLVTPQVVLFGKKDYQQWLLIRLMVADLGLPIEVVGCETVRAPDGLALSSRNSYLSPPERALAPALYTILRGLGTKITTSSGDWQAHEKQAFAELAAVGFQPDYISIRRQADLALPLPSDKKLVILAAAKLGRTRLIDNLEVDLNLPG